LKPEFDLVGKAEDGRRLVIDAERLRPDVIVAEISLPLLNGIEAARQLRKMRVKARFVFLTMQTDLSYLPWALAAGATGYVLKQCAASELITAIHRALQGKVYISSRVPNDGLQMLAAEINHRRNPAIHLTPRQREVLQLLAEGCSTKEAAKVLDVSARTVEFHKYQMMEELHLHRMAELIQYAIRHGIVSLNPDLPDDLTYQCGAGAAV